MVLYHESGVLSSAVRNIAKKKWPLTTIFHLAAKGHFCSLLVSNIILYTSLSLSTFRYFSAHPKTHFSFIYSCELLFVLSALNFTKGDWSISDFIRKSLHPAWTSKNSQFYIMICVTPPCNFRRSYTPTAPSRAFSPRLRLTHIHSIRSAFTLSLNHFLIGIYLPFLKIRIVRLFTFSWDRTFLSWLYSTI